MVDKNLFVVKSNNLIEAFTDMTQNECKIVAYLISKIKPDDKEFLTQSINVNELNELLNIKGTKSHTYIKLYSDALLKKKITIRYDNNDWRELVWFDEVSYINSESTLNLCFNSKLKHELLYLHNNYTKYILKNICNLNSPYSIRIYELLKQYEYINSRTLTTIELKAILGIKDKYKLYADLKKYVILFAQKELLKTDIYFEFEEIKKGRRVDAIKFNIFKNATSASHDPDEDAIAKEENNSNLKTEIENTVGGNLGSKGFKYLMDNVPVDTIRLYLDNWSKFAPGKNPVGFFINACVEKYDIPKTINNKPIQATNYPQREYDEDFFNSLYKNYEFVKDELK